MFSRQFDGSFIGFRSGVAEEDAVGAAVIHQPLRQLFLFRNPVQVGDVLKTAKLPLQLAPHHSVAVAQGVRGDPCDGVQIALTAIVPDPAPLAADEGEGKTAVGVHHGAGGRRTHGRIGDTNTLQDCVDQASHATDAGISTF